MRGAEAIVTRKTLLGRSAVIKNRIKKSYRIEQLDEMLRIQRTRREARLLHKAKLAKVSCPTVLEVSKYALVLSFMKGKRIVKFDHKKAFLAGNILAKLHNAGIIHGDFTPANLLFYKNNISVIDFGLGFFSSNIEDKAVDLLTMLKSINVPFERGAASFNQVNAAAFSSLAERRNVLWACESADSPGEKNQRVFYNPRTTHCSLGSANATRLLGSFESCKRRATSKSVQRSLIRGYAKCTEYNLVLERVEQIKLRVRYA